MGEVTRPRSHSGHTVELELNVGSLSRACAASQTPVCKEARGCMLAVFPLLCHNLTRSQSLSCIRDTCRYVKKHSAGIHPQSF